ncbi:hypothetical protein HDU96_010023 [Phlyctochytrium bullatum]|nr:hypothetical protein HDU96_010023 [Phlyctochytrium bullatum]
MTNHFFDVASPSVLLRIVLHLHPYTVSTILPLLNRAWCTALTKSPALVLHLQPPSRPPASTPPPASLDWTHVSSPHIAACIVSHGFDSSALDMMCGGDANTRAKLMRRCVRVFDKCGLERFFGGRERRGWRFFAENDEPGLLRKILRCFVRGKEAPAVPVAVVNDMLASVMRLALTSKEQGPGVLKMLLDLPHDAPDAHCSGLVFPGPTTAFAIPGWLDTTAWDVLQVLLDDPRGNTPAIRQRVAREAFLGARLLNLLDGYCGPNEGLGVVHQDTFNNDRWSEEVSVEDLLRVLADTRIELTHAHHCDVAMIAVHLDSVPVLHGLLDSARRRHIDLFPAVDDDQPEVRDPLVMACFDLMEKHGGDKAFADAMLDQPELDREEHPDVFVNLTAYALQEASFPVVEYFQEHASLEISAHVHEQTSDDDVGLGDSRHLVIRLDGIDVTKTIDFAHHWLQAFRVADTRLLKLLLPFHPVFDPTHPTHDPTIAPVDTTLADKGFLLQLIGTPLCGPESNEAYECLFTAARQKRLTLRPHLLPLTRDYDHPCCLFQIDQFDVDVIHVFLSTLPATRWRDLIHPTSCFVLVGGGGPPLPRPRLPRRHRPSSSSPSPPTSRTPTIRAQLSLDFVHALPPGSVPGPHGV